MIDENCNDVVLGWVSGDLVHVDWMACVLHARLPVISAQGGPFLSQTRGAMVSGFLTSYPDKDYLLITDTDMVFTNDDIAILRSHDADLAGGVYLISGDPRKVCAGTWDEGALAFAPAGFVKEVDFIGTGFLMVHRRVFEKIGEKWFDYMYDPARPDVMIGEDLSFCHRVQDAGFKILLDTNVQLGHRKLTTLRP